MKKLLGTVLILSLLGGSAAVAAPYGQYDRGYSRQGNNNAAIAGVGLFALAAILAAQNHGPAYGYQQRYENRGWNRDRDDYRGGYGNWGGQDNRGGYGNRSYDRDGGNRGHDRDDGGRGR